MPLDVAAVSVAGRSVIAALRLPLMMLPSAGSRLAPAWRARQCTGDEFRGEAKVGMANESGMLAATFADWLQISDRTGMRSLTNVSHFLYSRAVRCKGACTEEQVAMQARAAGYRFTPLCGVNVSLRADRELCPGRDAATVFVGTLNRGH